MSQHRDSGLSFKDVVELGSKAVIGASAACFGIGLLIVNVWLSRHGVYSSEFVRTEYVLAGAAFISLMVFAGFGLEYFNSGIKYCLKLWRGGERLKSFWYTVSAICGLMLLPSFLMRPISGGRIDMAHWKILIAVPILIFSYLSARETISHVSKFWQQATAPTSANDGRRLLLHFDDRLFLVFPGFLAALALYATYVYPEISPEFGGGYKDNVFLYLTSDGHEIGERTGLPIQPDKSIGPVVLLTESDKDLSVARIDEGIVKSRAVRIKRELIGAIVTRLLEPAQPTPTTRPARPTEPGQTIQPSPPTSPTQPAAVKQPEPQVGKENKPSTPEHRGTN